MFCGKCGNMIPDGQAFCNFCGAPMNARQPNYQQPAYQQPVQPVNVQTPISTAKPMGWFKFLIYFLLWASAVLNLVSGIMAMTGAQYEIYGNSAEVVYYVLPDLEGLDIFCGIACIALAGLAIYTRFALAGYKAIGPKLLTVLYCASMVVALIYAISAVSIIEEVAGTLYDTSEFTSQVWSQAIVSTMMIVINSAYFNKRKEMFKN